MNSENQRARLLRSPSVLNLTTLNNGSGSTAEENVIRRSQTLRNRNIRRLLASNNGARANNSTGNATRRTNNRATAGVGARPPRPAHISFSNSVRRRTFNNNGRTHNNVIGIRNNASNNRRNNKNARNNRRNNNATFNNSQENSADLAAFVIFMLEDAVSEQAEQMGGLIATDGIHILSVTPSEIHGAVDIVKPDGSDLDTIEVRLPMQEVLDKYTADRNRNRNNTNF